MSDTPPASMSPDTPPSSTSPDTPPSPEPTFFLVGSVRSGTTVLRLLLGHHPEICRCDEFEFVAPLLEGLEGWPALAEYHEFLAHDRGFRMADYEIDPHLSFPDLARSFLDQRRAQDGRALVGATVHENFDQLVRIWPEARFIYLRRDPRDVARSCVQMGWAGNTWGGVRYWERAEERWARLRPRLAPDRFIEVHFEQLLEDPDGVLDEICSLLGTRFSPEMMRIEKGTTYARPNPALAKSWRDNAPARDIALVEARLGERLAETGYPASDLARVAAPPWVSLDDTWGRLRFTWRRYGFGLWLARAISQRLPLRGWRLRVQLRFDAITNQHLK